MDIFYNIIEVFGIYWQYLPEKIQALISTFKTHVIYKGLWALCIITLLVGVFFGLSIWKKYRIKYQKILEEKFKMGRPRFRKRDKVLFYGRRMLRKVQSISAESGGGKKRKALARLAKNIWYPRKENTPTLLRAVEPPAEYLEEASEGRDRVPPDAFYMLQSIRIFGHFEKPVFLKICKHTEIINLQAGEFLIKIGDPDESIFIVQSGVVNVYLNNSDGSLIPLKCVKKGETVTSLLSFVDVLVGNDSQYKTVTAKASEESQVIRVPMFAFKEVFNECPDILVRVIQIIMVRLHRVTMTALHNYLGLTTELVQQQVPKKKVPVKTSPGHKRTLSDIPPMVHSLAMPEPDMLADLNIENVRKVSVPGVDAVDPQLMKSIAVDGFKKVLGLHDKELAWIEDKIEIREVCAGTTLAHQGKNEDLSLIYLISGALFVIQGSTHVPEPKKDKEPHAITIYPGEIVGGLPVLTGESSMYSIRAKHFSRVALLPKNSVYDIMREKPSTVLDIANSVIKTLSPLVRQCDFALDWVFLESGRALYRQDEQSDSTFIVLSGRLRSVVTHANGKKEIVGEFGKGDLIGIVEMITETPRQTTVMAVRDSELAKLPEGLFNAIKIKYPVVVTQLISLLSHRILGSMKNTLRSGPTYSNPLTSVPFESNPAVTHRFSTVAIVAVNEDVPLTAFTYELYHSLSAIGPTLRLTSEVIRKTLGSSIMESASEYRLTSWLAQQEDQHNISLYQCDTNYSVWTQRCLRQADVILIVGLGDRPPTVGKLEREIDRLAIRTAKELILLHHESSSTRPTNTVQWLNMRAWVSRHHHIQCPKRMFTRKSHYRVNELYSKVLMSEANMHSDFSRLARWLTGNSVGLVLGGGGARGAAHVGMLKAIQEAGIPIDMVGGVSIGAFMGALWCHEKNIVTMTQKAREWCKRMTQWGRQLLDLTYPATSMFTGRDFNHTIRSTFGDVYIEDLWIPYFTLTTDITASCARVHTHGSTWRYIRGSMSLSGYMPPLCDPTDAHLLLDGGYVNNLPADVMRAQGAAHIIAVDVGSQDDTDLTDYGDDLSGWWLLYKRFNPFTSPVKVPNLPDIQSRLAYVSCVRQLEEVKNSDYCEYIRPPIDRYKTLAFGSFDEIKEVGYQHGKQHFEAMAKSGRLTRFKQWKSLEIPVKSTHALNEYTFVDLAQIVCKVPDPVPENQTSSESDGFGGYVSEPSSTARKITSPILKRTVSLSENEMDSDEMEMPLLRMRTPVPSRKLENNHESE